MDIKKITKNNIDIANIIADDIVIKDVQSAIDTFMTVYYDLGTKNIAISKDLFVK